jgi:hypothetical protein
MPKSLQRSIAEPIRQGLNWDELWMGPDKGLIYCWERGRELQKENPELTESAKNGELPVMWWIGGVERKLKGKKQGTLFYLATWQGLRGDDLNIDPDGEDTEICTSTGQLVTFKRTILSKPE